MQSSQHKKLLQLRIRAKKRHLSSKYTDYNYRQTFLHHFCVIRIIQCSNVTRTLIFKSKGYTNKLFHISNNKKVRLFVRLS